MNKAIQRFSKKFKLIYDFPEWKHRGHNLCFPGGEFMMVLCIYTYMYFIPEQFPILNNNSKAKWVS